MSYLDNFKSLLNAYGRPICEYVCNLEDEEITLIANLLGADCTLIKNLAEVGLNYLDGQLDTQKLLLLVAPTVVSIFAKFTNKNKANTSNISVKNSEKPTYSPTFENENGQSDNHLPVDNDEILYSLNAYFNS